ncbi:MAG: 3-oxoacyl-[acyl-carrier-protein] reductase [Pseudomonadota bacterium]
MTGSLTGKTALVTGAGRGIGKAVAKRLAQDGAHVVLNDIDSKAVEALAQELAVPGRKILALGGSVGVAGDVKALFSSVEKESGGLDILVNNAGITRDNMLLKMTDKDWDEVMDINLKSVFFCCREAAALMKDQGHGRIINLTSVAAVMVKAGQANYTASKAGVIGLTRTLSKELARYGILVNAVAPGFIESPMTDLIPDQIRQAMIRSIPLARPGTPEDVAGLVSFLASKDSAYITGQVISCNGGLY